MNAIRPRPRVASHSRRLMRRLVRLIVVMLWAGALLVPPAGAVPRSTPAGPSTHVPVYAYFYQWYDRASWNRAKKDYPLVGRYSSDDPHVLREQVVRAQSAGIDGFLTSWKSTPTLNRRLTLLLTVARDQHFDVGVVYEALDFRREPLPIATVRADMLHLVRQWGPQLRSARYDRPLIIWTGTDRYSTADVQSVHKALGQSAYLLAASKSVAAYERVAADVDGQAYYWSSANPNASSTAPKLDEMSAAVHRHHGIWIAPSTSGFDGTTLGHSRVIDRAEGRTLQRSLVNAFNSAPDIVGVISWNEWSENTYIEPGERYGTQELDVLGAFLRGRNGSTAAGPQTSPASGPRQASWSGLRAVLLLSLLSAAGIVYLGLRLGPRDDDSPPPAGPDRDDVNRAAAKFDRVS